MVNLKNPILLIFSIILCNLAGIIGSVFTASSVSTWYVDLVKPSFNPPGWVFAPVWTILYILMGISLYLILKKGIKTKISKIAISVFSIQLFLNALWSFLFFGLKNPFYAFIEILILLAAITASIFYFYKIDKKAAYLLVPYLAWVCFASVLNYFIYRFTYLAF